MSVESCDYLIIGAGIIGVNIARELITRFPESKIIILEKEESCGFHSSGRNSGVLHTGFYYQTDSLKAKFTNTGNQEMLSYCEKNNIKVNRCGKVVIANNENELLTLTELQRRGDLNGSEVSIIDEATLKEIEPNAKTYKRAIFSPKTATVNPKEVLKCMVQEAILKKVAFRYNEAYAKQTNHIIFTSKNKQIIAKKIINSAGLYADKIALDFGYSKNYLILPFKGLYLKYNGQDKFIRTNIYPVPNINNPFLGVHCTVTVDGGIKIGPTAIPAFWRENYRGFKGFKLNEMLGITLLEARLLLSNNFNFRNLALEEIKKYKTSYLLQLAEKMLNISLNKTDFTWGESGIRAQLFDIHNKSLVNDFLIEGDSRSIHILNAVSPGFTCSIPFARFVVDKYILDQKYTIGR